MSLTHEEKRLLRAARVVVELHKSKDGRVPDAHVMALEEAVYHFSEAKKK